MLGLTRSVVFYSPNEFYCSTADSSMFICRTNRGIIIFLLYVDDMITTGDCKEFLEWFIKQLGTAFAMKDLGFLHYFLSIEVTKTARGLHLCQHKYANDLLARADLSVCKPTSTPMVLRKSLNSLTADYSNPTLYRSIVGGLQYLTITRPDISYSVNYVCQQMAKPSIEHFQDVKRTLRYVRGTTTQGIQIFSSGSPTLSALFDSDWAGCPSTRRSTTDFCTFLGNTCISWSAKKQPTVARSSAEAEYRALASTAAELTWLSYVLRDIGAYISAPPILYCDNLSALYMTVNSVFHARTKHIQVDYHYFWEKVALGSLVTKFISSSEQLADLLTKSLPKLHFRMLCSKLGLVQSPRPNLQGSIKKTDMIKSI